MQGRGGGRVGEIGIARRSAKQCIEWCVLGDAVGIKLLVAHASTHTSQGFSFGSETPRSCGHLQKPCLTLGSDGVPDHCGHGCKLKRVHVCTHVPHTFTRTASTMHARTHAHLLVCHLCQQPQWCLGDPSSNPLRTTNHCGRNRER